MAEIYLQYKELMYKVARRYFGSSTADIEDAMSAAVEQMCSYVDSFRAVKEGNMKSYVLRMTGNVCRKMKMAQRARDALRDPIASAETVENIADADDPYASAFDYADAVAMLEAFSGLSERDKDLIRLRHIDQLDISEIAERLQMSDSAVRTALSRAKRRAQNLAAEGKCKLP
ncbi:MAG: sigma-70 family RNA polymerase sigma factor [Clostridia bacterium]|nr:sigma-70 family RNA polymerase sigma factor [Clostridia bacterium]